MGDRKAEISATALWLADELGPDRLTTIAFAQAVVLTQAVTQDEKIYGRFDRLFHLRDGRREGQEGSKT